MLRGVHASGPEPGESAISLQNKLDGESERRDTSELLDVLVRAGLILALAALCYQVFAPF